MKRIVILNVIILLTVCFRIRNEEKFVRFQGNASLGFSNRTGSGCSQAQFLSFINYINLASTYHQKDEKSLLNYISTALFQNYGQSPAKYSVILQTHDSEVNWYLQIVDYEYATTSSKVDKNFPTNSYMFVKIEDYGKNHNETYFSKLTTGSGISSSVQKVIKQIVLEEQEGSGCKCRPGAISDKLYKYDGKLWSVICSDQQNHHFLIHPKSNQYIYTKPRNCYYAIWVI